MESTAAELGEEGHKPANGAAEGLEAWVLPKVPPTLPFLGRQVRSDGTEVVMEGEGKPEGAGRAYLPR